MGNKPTIAEIETALDRPLAVAVAICTKLMRWFGRLHAFFQRIGERAGFSDWGQLISFLLCVPCFQASNFFFKIAYALNQRKLVRLSIKCMHSIARRCSRRSVR